MEGSPGEGLRSTARNVHCLGNLLEHLVVGGLRHPSGQSSCSATAIRILLDPFKEE